MGKTGTNNGSPVRQYRTIIDDSNNSSYINRVAIGTAATGLVRVEWVAARYGQIIPTNWSVITLNQYLDSYIPLRYQVADAQNAIVQYAIEKDFEWLLLYEHDVLPPPDAFIRVNDYIRRADTPVVSGLYYTRSRPSEPVLYRGRGTSYYDDWEMGDLVWVDGVPTGFLLVHMGIIRAMYAESDEYILNNKPVRRVFHTPNDIWFDPDDPLRTVTISGTSDLHWCTRVIKEDYLAKAGWEEFADMEYPFLVDTNLYCKHINPDGEQFP